ncbi:hypothetical protein LTR09_010603 [Extremus antarcticus]|uniref:Uncharacterized protein n=1 Tax=Extremus antarcticus TaxID=702011 RepID=A0AAJ0DDK7_9PEZI|nr:hypothetical protein LTR09_010603 [Extremus antarcticus]
MLKPDEKQGTDPSKTPVRSKSGPSASLSTQPAASPAKRKASSPPRSEGIPGVHRTEYDLVAVEPGLTLQSFKELAESINPDHTREILLDLIEFEHKKLSSKLFRLATAFSHMAEPAFAAPQSAPVVVEREKVDVLEKQRGGLMDQVEHWSYKTDEVRRRYPDIEDWALNLKKEMTNTTKTIKGLSIESENATRSREDNRLKALFATADPEPVDPKPRGRAEERASKPNYWTTPSPPPPGVRPADDWRKQTDSPESIGGKKDPEDDTKTKASGSKGKGKAQAPGLPGPGTQGGRSQKRRSTNNPGEVSVAFQAMLGVFIAGERTRPNFTDLREALIESFEFGDDWYIFNVDGSKEDRDVSNLTRKVNAL